jgi:hypothetical protein
VCARVCLRERERGGGGGAPRVEIEGPATEEKSDGRIRQERGTFTYKTLLLNKFILGA